MKTEYGKSLVSISLITNIILILSAIEDITDTPTNSVVYILNGITSAMISVYITNYIYKRINKDLNND